MNHQVFLLVFFLICSLALLWSLCWPHQGRAQSSTAAKMRTRLQRHLKPRCPDDCPACRLASIPSSGGGPAPLAVRSWPEVKSRRGAPKRIDTAGFACPNHQCPYFGITDAQIHALVGDGKHGSAERIQTFRCQACHSTFTARRHTPLYRLKTPSHQIAMVLSALAEGLDASAAERVFGYRQATITTWLTRAGGHAELFHERCFRNLHIPHLQLDEIRTRLRSSTQVLWLWLAIDPLTKILPVLSLGPRTQHMAHLLIHSLRQSLAPGCLPLFTSDGLNFYFYALTAHFGQWLVLSHRGRNVRQWQVEAGLIYGQVKKSYRRRRLIRVSQVMRLGTEAALTATLQGLGLSGRLNTAFIERVNLTVRHGIAALTRRTWATAQQTPYLLAHLEWWRTYYHFVRPHQSLRVALVQPREREGKLLAQRYRQRTPAMAAGRTHRQWTACELLSCRRFPLERHASLMWEKCHVTRKTVKVPAAEVRWNLIPG
jgi:IS1 family transposase/transposase-like protein